MWRHWECVLGRAERDEELFRDEGDGQGGAGGEEETPEGADGEGDLAVFRPPVLAHIVHTFRDGEVLLLGDGVLPWGRPARSTAEAAWEVFP